MQQTSLEFCSYGSKCDQKLRPKVQTTRNQLGEGPQMYLSSREEVKEAIMVKISSFKTEGRFNEKHYAGNEALRAI